MVTAVGGVSHDTVLKANHWCPQNYRNNRSDSSSSAKNGINLPETIQAKPKAISAMASP